MCITICTDCTMFCYKPLGPFCLIVITPSPISVATRTRTPHRECHLFAVGCGTHLHASLSLLSLCHIKNSYLPSGPSTHGHTTINLCLSLFHYFFYTIVNLHNPCVFNKRFHQCYVCLLSMSTKSNFKPLH